MPYYFNNKFPQDCHSVGISARNQKNGAFEYGET